MRSAIGIRCGEVSVTLVEKVSRVSLDASLSPIADAVPVLDMYAPEVAATYRGRHVG